MYRKKINGMLIVGTLFFIGMTGSLYAQNIPTSPTEVPGSYDDVSLKQNKVPEAQAVRGEDIVWKRDVYRIIDLHKIQNGGLYYPAEPNGDQKNLFTTLFELVAYNQIPAYEYIDGREVFTDKYLVDIKVMLKGFEIPFKEKKDPKDTKKSIFDIDGTDIPSTEVIQFYVKEIYFLNQRNSSMEVKTLALCPILSREDEMGVVRTFPMFWVTFESIRPYLSQMSIAADSLNSATNLSVYDFFNQRRYQGDIYKVSNLKNQNIKEYCETPEEVTAEQIRLEKELSNIGSSLWEPSQRALREEEEIQKAKSRKALATEKKKK